ncbi:VanZ family protein [Salisediminibacterium selenitireducens]|uniref:VanZ family protein n=1 Tax=Bacillus selenitireducens (strain ATCC 700615 / DSM 15326 / MLS10) TaxID=439292 RepID=D6XU93_BACIE|nr:VanZ family protein [Salisediminibacterium selenitireducens]ADH99379.1 VanZ family protein [[Bacillus] selenitireducens MLS10]
MKKPQEMSKSGPLKFALLVMFIVYMGLLFYIVFFAWNHGSSFGPVGPGGRNYNLEPGLSIERILRYSPDATNPVRILGGNILMFIPFGMLFPLLILIFFNRRMTVVAVTFVSALLSLFIEVNQFLFTYRVANVDDILLNSLGGFLGAIIYSIIRKQLSA